MLWKTFGKNRLNNTLVEGRLAATMAQQISIVDAIDTQAVFHEASSVAYNFIT